MKLVEIRCKEGILNVWDGRKFVSAFAFNDNDIDIDVIEYARKGEPIWEYGEDTNYEGVC
jgi:hypothetical protein